MAEFVIKLADERGRVQEQVHNAASAEELRHRFSQAGYYIYSVKPRGLTGSQRKTKLETFIIFNQQFLTLVRAGLPILGSLEMLAKSQKNANFAGQLQNVAARVRTGESISSAFEAQGGFPVIYTTTLLAGERSGNLEEVLGRFLSFQRIALTFRKKLTASLIYPAVLITLVFGLFIFLISFVVPRFAQLYDQIGSKLPAITLCSAGGGKYCAEICSLCAADAGAPCLSALPVEQNRSGSRPHRQNSHQAAAVWNYLAEVPGGLVFTNAFHAAQRRTSAGSIA